MAREIRDVLKHIEMQPRVRASDPKQDGSKYVCIDSTHITMPRETWNLIKPSVIKLNYQYKDGRLWYIEKDQGISTSSFTEDELTALKVAYRMEHGNDNA